MVSRKKRVSRRTSRRQSRRRLSRKGASKFSKTVSKKSSKRIASRRRSSKRGGMIRVQIGGRGSLRANNILNGINTIYSKITIDQLISKIGFKLNNNNTIIPDESVIKDPELYEKILSSEEIKDGMKINIDERLLSNLINNFIRNLNDYINEIKRKNGEQPDDDRNISYADLIIKNTTVQDLYNIFLEKISKKEIYDRLYPRDLSIPVEQNIDNMTTDQSNEQNTVNLSNTPLNPEQGQQQYDESYESGESSKNEESDEQNTNNGPYQTSY